MVTTSGLPTLWKSHGQRCYEAYRTHAGRRSLVTGADLPEWEGMPPEIQAAWQAAASAVLSGIEASER